MAKTKTDEANGQIGDLARLEATVTAAADAAQRAADAHRSLGEGLETRIDNVAGLVRALGDALGPRIEALIQAHDRLDRSVSKLDGDTELLVVAVRALAEEMEARRIVGPTLAKLNERRPQRKRRREK